MREWLRGLLGRRGERQAAAFLKARGFRILRRGMSNRFGEIDLVALDGETIVFVEVRTRRSLDTGHPAESITIHKQRHLSRAAMAYLKAHGLLDRRCRFDAVAIVWPDDGPPQIEHFVNAFELAIEG